VFIYQTTSYERTDQRRLIGVRTLMRTHGRARCVLQLAPVDVTLPTFVFLEVPASEPGRSAAVHQRQRSPSPRRSRTGASVAVRCSSASGDRSNRRCTHAYVERVNIDHAVVDVLRGQAGTAIVRADLGETTSTRIPAWLPGDRGRRPRRRARVLRGKTHPGARDRGRAVARTAARCAPRPRRSSHRTTAAVFAARMSSSEVGATPCRSRSPPQRIPSRSREGPATGISSLSPEPDERPAGGWVRGDLPVCKFFRAGEDEPRTTALASSHGRWYRCYDHLDRSRRTPTNRHLVQPIRCARKSREVDGELL